MKKDILVPDIGDFENVEIIEVLVKEGQKIQKNEEYQAFLLGLISIFRLYYI